MLHSAGKIFAAHPSDSPSPALPNSPSPSRRLYHDKPPILPVLAI